MAIDADYVLRRMALGEAVRERDVLGSVVDELVRRGCVVKGGYIRPPGWTKRTPLTQEQKRDRWRKQKSKSRKAARNEGGGKRARLHKKRRELLVELLSSGPRAESVVESHLGCYCKAARNIARQVGAEIAIEMHLDGRGCRRQVRIYRMAGDRRQMPDTPSIQEHRREAVKRAARDGVSAFDLARWCGVCVETAVRDLHAVGAVRDGVLWRLAAEGVR